MKPVTLTTLSTLKAKGERFSVLTSYDSTFAHWVSSEGVEVILVGDSLGMVLQGNDSTLAVTMRDMIYHTHCVAQGNTGSLIIADMPFMSFSTPEKSMNNAAKLMAAGAHMVKLEGGRWLAETVNKLKDCGIPVCIHLGLTPQSVHKFGGYKVQGRKQDSAEIIKEDAAIMVKAGADILLLECVPSTLATEVTQQSPVPVIGIGAGGNCDAQVLVIYDMLGITPGHTAKFVKNFMTESNDSIQGAIRAYHKAVKEGSFPSKEHEFS